MKFLLIVFLFLQSMFAQSQPRFNKASAVKFQQELNLQFADSLKSPLTKKDLANFKKLDFFQIDSSYSVVAKLVRTPYAKPKKMKTSTDRTPTYVVYGVLHFTLHGKRLRLNVYKSAEPGPQARYDDHLFLPFSDLTNGNESYIGGRYIDLIIPETEFITIDFNKAYNPYCAYNHIYSCPKVPLENDLPIAIYAGVKKHHD